VADYNRWPAAAISPTDSYLQIQQIYRWFLKASKDLAKFEHSQRSKYEFTKRIYIHMYIISPLAIKEVDIL